MLDKLSPLGAQVVFSNQASLPWELYAYLQSQRMGMSEAGPLSR